jgi:ABC-type multidrug transport system fused ATPase/permease subunit
MAAITSPPEEIILKGYDPNLTRRLLKFVRPYWLSLMAALILILLSSAASVAGPYLIKDA